MKSEEFENKQIRGEESAVKAFFFNSPDEWGSLFEEEIHSEQVDCQ